MKIKKSSIAKMIASIFVVFSIFLTLPFLFSNNKNQSNFNNNNKSKLYKTKDKNIEKINALNTIYKVKKIIQTSVSEITSSALIEDENSKTHLYFWGNNTDSQSGTGSNEKIISMPKEVIFPHNILSNGSKITQISMTDKTSSALVLDEKGETHLYMWGSNSSGQQGDGNHNIFDEQTNEIVKEASNINTPKEVKKLTKILKSGDKIIQISMTPETSWALIQDSKNKRHLYLWGIDYAEQNNKIKNESENEFVVKTPSGFLSYTTPTEFKKMTEIVKSKDKIMQISMAHQISSAVVKDEEEKYHIYMWGSNNILGQMGQESRSEKSFKKPTEVKKLNKVLKSGDKIIQISISAWTSSALIEDSLGNTHLYMWGSNVLLQQGGGKFGDMNDCISTPTEVKKLKNKLSSGDKIIAISSTMYNSSALVKNKNGNTHLYMWGMVSFIEFTDELPILKKFTTYPTEVKFSNKDIFKNSSKILKISMSNNTSSATLKDKNGNEHLYMWGTNKDNKLLPSNVNYVKDPTKISFFYSQIMQSKYKEKIKNILIYLIPIPILLFIFVVYKLKSFRKNNKK